MAVLPEKKPERGQLPYKIVLFYSDEAKLDNQTFFVRAATLWKYGTAQHTAVFFFYKLNLIRYVLVNDLIHLLHYSECLILV